MKNELVHTFAGNPLDRAENLRRHPERLAELQNRADARYLPFAALKVAQTSERNLLWLGAEDLPSNLPEPVLLGLQDGVPHYAIALDADTAPDDLDFTDCRLLAGTLPTPDAGILAQARAQLDWHQRNPFCARCGAPSKSERAGHIRRCTGCERHIFPRTDPVAIMLVFA